MFEGDDNKFDPEDLIALARGYLDSAHAPYSGFPVAAVVVDDQGRVFGGVNVENASYGLTMCAERVAVYSAIAAGAKRICAVAVVAKKLKEITPCGACRQVLAEFCKPGVRVYTDSEVQISVSWSIEELLPHAFTSVDLSVKT